MSSIFQEKLEYLGNERRSFKKETSFLLTFKGLLKKQTQFLLHMVEIVRRGKLGKSGELVGIKMVKPVIMKIDVFKTQVEKFVKYRRGSDVGVPNHS